MASLTARRFPGEAAGGHPTAALSGRSRDDRPACTRYVPGTVVQRPAAVSQTDSGRPAARPGSVTQSWAVSAPAGVRVAGRRQGGLERRRDHGGECYGQEQA
ncbi:hypothetical protein GCM10009850_081080 [Nonomuraea monospora]|uniref:Uncharacterized protein n=1 Tax=Nonomuraea monospora TaxID=568818 RepID=A0ABN3CT68_9ACTN